MVSTCQERPCIGVVAGVDRLSPEAHARDSSEREQTPARHRPSLLTSCLSGALGLLVARFSFSLFRPHSSEPMASFFQVPDARRIRSFFTKLPLATRILLALLTAFWIAHVFRPELEQWGALIPQEINIGTREFSRRKSTDITNKANRIP